MECLLENLQQLCSSAVYVLRHILKRMYKNPDLAKRDVLNVFTSFNDLRPKLDNYVFDDGTKKTLLQLAGTIPVNYKGSVYNIPVCIWLGDTHPYNPPMVYVKPTSTMLIKSGRNVDQNGKVDLPYLREWRYPNSDLLGMIQILTIVFGEEPPVYSRAAAAQQNQYPPQGQTPYPPAGGGFPMPTPGMAGSPYPAQNTPYPSIPPGGYPQQQGSYPGQFSVEDHVGVTDDFYVVLRCKNSYDGYSTNVLKAGRGFESLKWRFAFKNKEKSNRLSQKFKEIDAVVNFKDVVIETDRVWKYTDFQRNVKGLIVEEIADVKVDEIHIDANEAREVIKVVTATCPVFTNLEAVIFMEGSSGRTRLWFVALDRVYDASLMAFRKAQNYISHVLKPV